MQAQQAGDMRRLEEQMSQQQLIIRFGLRDPCQGLLRNNQSVSGRLRLNVVKGDQLFVLVDDASRDLSQNNFLKERHRPNLAVESVDAQHTSARSLRALHPQPEVGHDTIADLLAAGGPAFGCAQGHGAFPQPTVDQQV